MPEGDTLFRIARTLERRLAGRRLVRCASDVAAIARRDDLVGREVTQVRAYGKYLLVHLGARDASETDGEAARWQHEPVVLRTHLKMDGTWHVYRPGEAWMLPRSAARLTLEVEGTVAVCFSAPVVEIDSERGADVALTELGPDLLAPDIDLERAAARLATYEGQIGVALMNQRLVAGIGNVYKSEVLFIERVDPFAEVATLRRETLLALLGTARRLLHANVLPSAGRRRTRSAPGPAYWVYERSGQPCLRCGERVRMRRQGALGRSTYFCARCQAVAASSRKRDVIA